MAKVEVFNVGGCAHYVDRGMRNVPDYDEGQDIAPAPEVYPEQKRIAALMAAMKKETDGRFRRVEGCRDDDPRWDMKRGTLMVSYCEGVDEQPLWVHLGPSGNTWYKYTRLEEVKDE